MAGGKGFDLGNYVEVADRITKFYERHPDGRIAEVGKPEVITIGNRTFIGVTVAVYRGPDDAQPCTGTAWEPYPGATPYTKDSEMMNAGTSAIGRALVASGILAKGEKVASRDEIRNRANANEAGTAPSAQPEASPSLPANSGAPPPASTTGKFHAGNGEIGDIETLYALGEKVDPKQNRLQIDDLVRRKGYAVIKERLEKALEKPSA